MTVPNKRERREPDVRDVIVVGGGPGGASTAGFLARAGVDVLVLEKLEFPRFRIGESLLPFQLPILERLGVLEKVRRANFMVKPGATFLAEDSGGRRTVNFVHGWDGEHSFSYQVPRAEFDSLMLGHARECGAEVRHGVDVKRVLFDGARAFGVEVQESDGSRREIRARVIVDASGGAAILSGPLKLRVPYPKMRRAALFAHYRNARPHPDARPGDILLPIRPDAWFWHIPFSDGSASVGAVFEPEKGKGRAGDVDGLLASLLAESPAMSFVLEGAERISEVRGASDFSWRSRFFAGEGWALVGDAAGFLDPTFSTGVFLAMTMGEKVAAAIAPALARKGSVSRRDLLGFERESLKVLNAFRRYVEAFYSPGFMKTLCTPAPTDAILRAVTSVLAGGYEQLPLSAKFWNNVFFLSYAIDRRISRLTGPVSGAG
ncbi:MAG: NAD(P)/FAD-dependent oxidoreductase [Thermoanaerobaculia bacterium]